MTRPLPWPWPQDTPEDKAKRVALSYRGLLQRITQGQCKDPAGDLHRLDDHWHNLGHYWMTPTQAPLDEDAWLSAADLVVALSHLHHFTENQVRNWAYRRRRRIGDGITETTDHTGRPLYNVGDALAYLTRQRNRRPIRGRA
jgi:hypothetical protein